MVKKLENVEPAYAQAQVDGIDARLEAIEVEKKELAERRKLFVGHLPKKTTAKKD